MADTLEQKDALQLITERFASYGISNLAKTVHDLVVKYTDAEGKVFTSLVTSELRKTPEYTKRFSGNLTRKALIEQDIAAGKQPRFGILSEADYITAENNYRDVLRDYTIPGFYDTNEDMAKLIGNDLSVKEVQARAESAQQAASSANPEIKAQLKAMYGIEDNQIAAFFLDPEAAKTALKPVAAANAAALSAAAQRGGLSLTKQEAEKLATQVAPNPTDVVNANQIFQDTQTTASLAEASVSGVQSTVGATDIVGAAANQAQSVEAVKKEKQRRQAEYQAASGMAETQTGVVGLQRANL